MSLYINPCLFVGIGSTGLQTLEALRRLFYEEFNMAGLPCFRYVVLETNAAAKADDSFLTRQPKSHERIDVIPMVIPDLNEVKKSTALDDWLDPRTLKLSQTQKGYTDGAGHRRQAGRLCLWENWITVTNAIDAALAGIKTNESREDANAFLRDVYFPRKSKHATLPTDSLVKGSRRVYLTGTLCGGTCSGTFIDLGFYLRDQLGGRSRSNLLALDVPEIIGLFTIPDTVYVKQTGSTPHVASCWAALSELDYYTKQGSGYEAEFPNWKFNCHEAPFTTVYLVSQSNMGSSRFPDQQASDEKGSDQGAGSRPPRTAAPESSNSRKAPTSGLVQMCAMNLFTEVVAGMAEIKAANRVNLPAAGFFQTDDETQQVRAFSSFGLSAIWYPRYRITRAICYQLAEDMALDWLGKEPSHPADIAERFKSDWKTTLDWAGNYLLGVAIDGPFKGELPTVITQLFTRKGPEFLAASRDGLKAYILNLRCGKDNSKIDDCFNRKGEFYLNVSAAATTLPGDLQRRLRETVIKYLRTHTFVDTTSYIKMLKAQVTQTRNDIPGTLPPYSQDQDLSSLTEAYEDRATWILGQRSQVVENCKKSIWEKFKKQTLDHLNHLRDQFLKVALEKVEESVSSLAREVEMAETNVRSFEKHCQQVREELYRCPEPSNIVILFKSARNSIADDVNQGVAAIKLGTPMDVLRDKFCQIEDHSTHSAFDPLVSFGVAHENLMPMVETVYESLAQGQTGFEMGDEELKKTAANVENLVISSMPYFQPSPKWRPDDFAPPQLPNFIFCSQDAIPRLIGNANRFVQQNKTARYAGQPSTLGHFVFFYQETLGLQLSDLEIAKLAADKLREVESRTGSTEPTLYSHHKRGRSMFDQRFVLDTALHWIRDTQALAPEVFKTLGGKEPYLEYRLASDPSISRDLYVNDARRVQELLGMEGLEGLIRILATSLRSVGRDKLINRMDARKNSETARVERENMTRSHEQILKTVFPTGV
jgi:Tubulin like